MYFDLLIFIFNFKFNLIITALTKSPSSSLVFRNSDYHLLTFSGYETQPRPIPKLPRVRLNNKNRVDMDAVNNAARNNYKQFLSK